MFNQKGDFMARSILATIHVGPEVVAPRVQAQQPNRARTASLLLLALFTTLLVGTQPAAALAPVGLPVAHLASNVSVLPGQAQGLSAPLVCQELVVNGAAETTGGWSYGPTPAPGTIVTTPVHGGNGAIRLGIAGGSNTVAYSTAYQSLTLPATGQLLLTYWERPSATGDSGDFREVLVLRPNLTTLRALGRQSGAGNDQWTQRTADLSDLAGQTVVLYFNVYNNGSGSTLVNYLDDISLQSCTTGAPTATPSATATTTATTTATPTATATGISTPATPTPTVTTTPVPSSLLVSAANVTVVQEDNTVHALVDLRGASNQQPVGVLSVDLAYDPAILSATTCTVSDRFDLLLCNITTAGLIQLAGVAAEGLRSDLTVAELDFTIRQLENLNTQLTVQIDEVADPTGAPLTATAQHGQVGAPCTPGSPGCPTTSTYLPLVQR